MSLGIPRQLLMPKSRAGEAGRKCCYVILLIISFSIFVSFILEAFFVEYSLEKSEVETAIEQKIQELGMGVQE